MSGRYAEFAPRADLAGHVACLWTFAGGQDTEDQHVAPDGRCELIVHCGPSYLERNADGALQAQPPALLAGQLTRPLRLRGPAGAAVIGVRFHPAGAFAYVGAAMSRVTDRRASLDEIHGPGAAARLADALQAAAADQRLAALQDHVADAIATRRCARDQMVELAVQRLEAGAGVEAVRAETGLSPRALQRRFAQRVGLPPQRLAAVFRLRRLLGALHDPSIGTWTAAAQAAGYFDHPQMAREFRRFMGCTPSQFAATEPGLAASLADLPV